MTFSYSLSQMQLESIEEILQKDLMDIGVNCAFLIDMAGNIISSQDNGRLQQDIYSLAALAAGNFGAISEMASILGEKEFSLLFHKGEQESIHFNKVLSDFLLITIFGQDLSLGFLRLKANEAITKINKLIQPDYH